jgi:hypothetical protein
MWKVDMPTNRSTVRLFLGILVGWQGPLVQVAWPAVTITTVEVDGQPQALPTALTATGHDQKPLRVPSTARSVRFQFTHDVSAGEAAVRLRYKLEGHDDACRELSTRMRVLVLFSGKGGGIVSSHEFYLEGETPQWNAELADALFVPRREHVLVPEGAAVAGISFVSHGGETGLGVIAMDGVRVLVERACVERAEVFDLGLTGGTDLDQPSGSPANWTRAGSRLELAELGIRAMPEPHPILVIRDDDPQNYGNWSLAPDRQIPVQPGDRLTIECQTVHSIGASGPGQAGYERLPPGSYWFRVVAVKANGAPTGQEVSLPLEVVVPMHLRLEFWLVLTALTGGAAAWLGRLALKRRMQQQIARLEQEQTLERERARIARDLHDEIAGCSVHRCPAAFLVSSRARGIEQRGQACPGGSGSAGDPNGLVHPADHHRRQWSRLCAGANRSGRGPRGVGKHAPTPGGDRRPVFAGKSTRRRDSRRIPDAAGDV